MEGATRSRNSTYTTTYLPSAYSARTRALHRRKHRLRLRSRIYISSSAVTWRTRMASWDASPCRSCRLLPDAANASSNAFQTISPRAHRHRLIALLPTACGAAVITHEHAPHLYGAAIVLRTRTSSTMRFCVVSRQRSSGRVTAGTMISFRMHALVALLRAVA